MKILFFITTVLFFQANLNASICKGPIESKEDDLVTYLNNPSDKVSVRYDELPTWNFSKDLDIFINSSFNVKNKSLNEIKTFFTPGQDNFLKLLQSIGESSIYTKEVYKSTFDVPKAGLKLCEKMGVKLVNNILFSIDSSVDNSIDGSTIRLTTKNLTDLKGERIDHIKNIEINVTIKEKIDGSHDVKISQKVTLFKDFINNFKGPGMKIALGIAEDQLESIGENAIFLVKN